MILVGWENGAATAEEAEEVAAEVEEATTIDVIVATVVTEGHVAARVVACPDRFEKNARQQGVASSRSYCDGYWTAPVDDEAPSLAARAHVEPAVPGSDVKAEPALVAASGVETRANFEWL